MRDPERIDRIINKLRQLWYISPDQRLGQLVSNITRDELGYTNMQYMFSLEDDLVEPMIDAALARGHG